MTLETQKPKIPVFERWFGTWQIAVNRRGFSADDLRKAYDDEASVWTSKLTKLGFLEAYRHLMASFVQRSKSAGDAPLRVLDCGVGTGALSMAFANEMTDPFDLSIVDISPSMLSEARSNLSNLSLRVEGRIANIQNLPYQAGYFDRVICAHTVEHLACPEAAIGEMCRVLKPGGTLLLVVTRKSAFGTYIHFKWRTQRLDPSSVRSWLEHHGLGDLEELPVGSGAWTRLWSRAIAGRKISAVNSSLQGNTTGSFRRTA
jgi:demethylmenaquinone methyltransferase/2-methoxy-6-polyprenyl-1,4-benzoquinol methylase